ncbi:centrosomal protein 15 isoform X1 [Melopsittacus undulatus]|uniref:centrosomal protein 15 isoform X1 n=1 Tax=Melopsittacus undulatus TaxID=13146 RepID=UPI00146F6175|nr:uncharacterized protein C3orf14 homolog isoform X1 [Melopsittacus undulatus]
MSSYLAQEVHLARRYEEILSQRSELLQQMETYLGDKKTKKTWQTQAADAAHKRNATLLNDIEAAEKKLQERVHLHPHPDTVKLEVAACPTNCCCGRSLTTNRPFGGSSWHPQKRNKEMKGLESLIFTTIYHQCIYSTLMKHCLNFNYNRDTPSMFSMYFFPLTVLNNGAPYCL